jgi:hypothetical protein
MNWRAFLIRGSGLAAGAASLLLLRPTISLAAGPVAGEDLVEAGEAFPRGSAQGVAVGATPWGVALQAERDGGVYTSGPLAAPFAFTHVGLHWDADLPPGAALAFELRTSADGAAWSAWRAAHLERTPEETPAGEYFASLVFAPGARHAQYRATFRAAGGAGPALRRVTATVIAAPAATAAAPLATVVVGSDSGPSLAVVTREAWGGDESMRFSRKGAELWPEMFVPAKKLVVHHTATRNDYANGDEAAAEVRAIYRYHTVAQRWGDIGYSALVDKLGNIYEGRHGRGGDPGDTLSSPEILSAGVVAGHDYHHNYGSAGVALLGDATQPSWSMTPSSPMWSSLVAYCAFEAGRHRVRPLTPEGAAAASDLLRSDDLWTNAMPNISGHRDTYATACPGDAVMAQLGALRQQVHAALTTQSGAGVAVAGGTREVTLGGSPAQLAFSWQPVPAGASITGNERCFEGWRMVTNSEDINYLSGYTAEAQPHQDWPPTDPLATSATYPVVEPGHYTLHVRAVLADGSKGPYAGSYTYLVTTAPTATKGKGR